MKIFWQYDKPLKNACSDNAVNYRININIEHDLTAAEIIDLSKEKTWSFNSLYPLLNKLLKKQFINNVYNERNILDIKLKILF